MEKPISNDLDRMDELAAALEAGGGKLLMGFQFRFHPGLKAVSRLLEEGAVGRPLSVRAHWGEYLPGWHPWEDYRKSYSARSDLGGGVVLTLCHPLDYLRWLLGEVVSVSAVSGKISDLEIDVEDFAEIGLEFEKNVHASVHLNYFQRPATHQLEMLGTQGTIRWDNADGAVQYYQADTGVWQTIPAPDNFDRNDLFMDETRHFLSVVKKESEPVCGLDDGIQDLKLVQAVYQASQTQTKIDFK